MHSRSRLQTETKQAGGEAVGELEQLRVGPADILVAHHQRFAAAVLARDAV
jgi:hypothetical protein